MDGFESAAHRREFFEGVKNRHIPVKFVYSGEASNHHASLSTYHDNVTSLETEVATLSAAEEWLADCRDICEIGPGNGYHTLSLLDYLNEVNRFPERYLAADFSTNLLEISTERIATEYPSLTVDATSWDVEAGPTNAIEDWSQEGPILVLFVGSTISNPMRPAEILQNVSTSIRSGDRLMLQLALWTDPETAEILESYQRDFFKTGILALLEMGGIDTDNGRFEVSLDRDTRTVYGDFHFEEPCDVEYDDDQVSFSKGESIRCFRSKRFLEQEIQSFLRDAGFKIVETNITADSGFATYLAEHS